LKRGLTIVRKTSFTYVAAAKKKLGGQYELRVSDNALSKALECSEAMIAKAKAGNMSDPLAIKLATFIGEDPGEVLLIARAEREKDQVVKEHLLRYAGKALRLVPSRAVSAVAALTVALSAALSPSPVQAFGGEGGIRTHVTA
jgi:hypothetical protein